MRVEASIGLGHYLEALYRIPTSRYRSRELRLVFMLRAQPASDLERSKVRLSPLAYRAYCGFGHQVWIVVHSKCELEFHWTRSVNLLTFCVDTACCFSVVHGKREAPGARFSELPDKEVVSWKRVTLIRRCQSFMS